MLVQAPGGTKHARNWALRPLFLAYKLGLETAQTSSGFSKKVLLNPDTADTILAAIVTSIATNYYRHHPLFLLLFLLVFFLFPPPPFSTHPSCDTAPAYNSSIPIIVIVITF